MGALSEVKVVGEVTHPEAIPYHEGMRVLDVVLAAGGLSPYAAGNRANIVRNVNGSTRKLRVNLTRLINKGDMSQNLPVQPGDVIVVPQTLF
jgi:polysaccharide export outer membrane protein